MSGADWRFAYLFRMPRGDWRCVHGNFAVWLPQDGERVQRAA